MYKNKCPECYSPNKSELPLVGELLCLQEHEQYICGTCGRCICIDEHPARHIRRWNFPFRTLDLAILYLRTADYIMKTNCKIYEITSKSGRISWKIFASAEEAAAFAVKNKDKKVSKKAVYKRKEYKEFPNTQVRKLTGEEIKMYTKKGHFAL